MSLQILPAAELPPKRQKTFFDQLLDRTLTEELERSIRVPTWVDTVGDSRVVEIRAKLDEAVLRVIVRRSQAYASNSHIFLLWMVGTSIVLLTVSILFLRNQIRPILRLGEAAEAFGKGRPIPEDFRPRGAREVRQAAYAFIEMRDRIERHVEQRTTMLAGVSHDLRTVLTRFKLQLAIFEDTSEIDALRSDANEMQLMLEDYMAFAKGLQRRRIPTRRRPHHHRRNSRRRSAPASRHRSVRPHPQTRNSAAAQAPGLQARPLQSRQQRLALWRQGRH